MSVENTFINSSASDGVMFVVGTSVVRRKEVLVITFLLLLWLYSVNRFISIWRDINYSAEHIPRNYDAALGKFFLITAISSGNVEWHFIMHSTLFNILLNCIMLVCRSFCTKLKFGRTKSLTFINMTFDAEILQSYLGIDLLVEWATGHLRSMKASSAKPMRTVRSSIRRRRERNRRPEGGLENISLDLITSHASTEVHGRRCNGKKCICEILVVWAKRNLNFILIYL